MPIKTIFVILSNSSIAANWFSISPADKLPLYPILPVAQKAQPKRQPACEETQTVILSFSGITAVSTILSSEYSNKYFFVPSCEICRLEYGFKIIGKREKYYQDGEDAHVMLKKLNEGAVYYEENYYRD